MLEEGLAGSVLEALNQPFDLSMALLELRAYARTKAAIDNAKDQASMPSGELADLVLENQAIIAREIMAERKRRRGSKP